MKNINSISLHLNVYDKVWVILENEILPSVKGSQRLGTVLNNKEDAEEAKKNGYTLLEMDWCRFQTLASEMRPAE